MIAKSRRKGLSADTGFWKNARNRGREAPPGVFLGGHCACFVRLPCLLRPCRLPALFVQHACAGRAACLLRAPESLVPPSRKGSRLLQSGIGKLQREHFRPSEAVVFSLSNVRISLSGCHAAAYGILLAFFRASRTEGRKNGFSRIGKVKVSKCKIEKRRMCRRADVGCAQVPVKPDCQQKVPGLGCA